jgi:cysteinyl-tRNA synthetase
MKRGYAYKAEDGSVYFKVSEFRRYGRLSGVKLTELKSAGRVSADHYEDKMVANDFALWKAWDADDGEVFWEAELGKGRPGWHIECSAMSMKYLGSSFDIHTGGMDLKFPHHENEIAQSESATGKRFAKYWVHPQFLTLKGEEMHKSIGNVVYLRDLVKEGRNPMAVRLFLISSKYRVTLDLTPAALDQAEAQRRRLQDFLARLREVRGGSGGDRLATNLVTAFERAMDDDLNTPRAIAAAFAVAKEANTLIDRGQLGERAAREIISALRRVDSVLGVMDFEEGTLSEDMRRLIQQREEARMRGDYAAADNLRAQLLEKGLVVEDTPTGTVWKKRSSS